MKRLIFLIFLGLLLHEEVSAEFSCEPKEISFPIVNDSFFKKEKISWQAITNNRYIEGGSNNCLLTVVVGYEGYPVYKCDYESVDAGSGYFKPVSASVLILNPSAKQLAAWAIHACRVNGATDDKMLSCLISLRKHVANSNGAQFPIAGSVIESICNSSTSTGSCKKHPKTNYEISALEPRNTIFRDGVAIYIEEITKWVVGQSLSKNIYSSLFDIPKSDIKITHWASMSRISGADRNDWIKWRDHINKPYNLVENGESFDLDRKGWQTISREVHKAACLSDSNELFDALVYSRQWAK